MECRLCKWFCDRFCPPDMGRDTFWNYIYKWEREESNDWDLWERDGESFQEQSDNAGELLRMGKKLQALAIFTSLADAGSAWAMRRAALIYERGWAGEPDPKLAAHYYSRALIAGSNSAFLELAFLYRSKNSGGDWQAILEQGSASGFIPADFWLAWFRYRDRPTRANARAVRPLLERAAAAGHPGARMTLAKWKAQGKFGLAEIRSGLREAGSVYREIRDSVERAPELGRVTPTPT